MPRSLRHAVGGAVYHVLNRANARLPLFECDGDYYAFERVLEQAFERLPMRILAYCVMPNHWHLVLWPSTGPDLSDFVGWLTKCHTQRWHAAHGTTGGGHLYQGRFRSFLVEEDEHLLTVCRYVERNPLRAGLVARAEEWRWSSLHRRMYGDAEARELLCEWPVPPPPDLATWVNEPQTDEEPAALRRSAVRGGPFGSEAWVRRRVEELGLQSTQRPPGRPRRG